MSIFVNANDPHIPVRFGMTKDDDSEVNVVWVKPHLTLGDVKKIEKSMFSLNMTQQMQDALQGDNADAAPDFAVNISPTQTMIENLRVAVIRWEGPIFEGVKYRPTIWESLDAQQCSWWIELVNKVVNGLNKPQVEKPESAAGGADPNPDEASTFEN